MTTSSRRDEHNAKIVRIYADQEQADAAALARYWDARWQGRAGDEADIDPGLREMVQLLEHYRALTGLAAPVSDPPAMPPPPAWRRSLHVAVLVCFLVLGLLFTSNTLLSPRSWLLSSAQDPDWIPWVSDDWLGERALTANGLVSAVTGRLDRAEGPGHGA